MTVKVKKFTFHDWHIMTDSQRLDYAVECRRTLTDLLYAVNYLLDHTDDGYCPDLDEQIDLLRECIGVSAVLESDEGL